MSDLHDAIETVRRRLWTICTNPATREEIDAFGAVIVAAERVPALEAEVERLRAPAARYEALCWLTCELGGPTGAVAVLYDVPRHLRTKGNAQLDALAESLIAEQAGEKVTG